MLLRDDAKIFQLIPEGWDPGALTLGAAGRVVRARQPWASASPTACSAVGSGMIVGLRVNALDARRLHSRLDRRALAPDPHGVLPDHPTRSQVLYWVMWPGIGMIMAGGLTALALRWRLLLEAFKAPRRGGRRRGIPAALDR